MAASREPCRLGYEEHDGSRYCFAHAGFVIAGTRSLLCDRRPAAEPWPSEPVSDECCASGRCEVCAPGGFGGSRYW